MTDNLALKVLAVSLILFSGGGAAALVLFQHETFELLKYVPTPDRCEQELAGICEMRCRSTNDCALQRVKH
jgi:hypothetical protein